MTLLHTKACPSPLPPPHRADNRHLHAEPAAPRAGPGRAAPRECGRREASCQGRRAPEPSPRKPRAPPSPRPAAKPPLRAQPAPQLLHRQDSGRMPSLPLNLQPSRSATGASAGPGLWCSPQKSRGLRKRPLCTGASDAQPPEVEKFRNTRSWRLPQISALFTIAEVRTSGVLHMSDTNATLCHSNIRQGLAGALFV